MEKEYNFIVVDDSDIFSSKIEKIIKSEFKNKKYNLYKFDDYDKGFYELTDRLIDNKVYILDIEVPSNDGISVAREIRRKDLESVIIFISGYEKEYSRIIWRSTLLIFSFIYKHGNFEAELKARLKDLIEKLHIKKSIILEDNDIKYRLVEDNILYLESHDRKTIVYTKNNSIETNKTLSELENMLSNNFIRTHKACIVNIKNIVSYNKNAIVFIDNVKTNLISRNYISNLKNYFKENKN